MIAIDKDMLMFMDVCLAKVVAVRFDVVQGFSGWVFGRYFPPEIWAFWFPKNKNFKPSESFAC